MAQIHHIHRRVDLTRPLLESQHDVRDLASSLIHLLTNRFTTMTPQQRTRLSEFRSERGRYKHLSDPFFSDKSRSKEDAKIKDYAGLFNHLIFQSNMTARVTFQLESVSGDGKDVGLGDTLPETEGGYAVIVLRSQGIQDSTERLKSCLGQMICGLVKAFLLIYACEACVAEQKWYGEGEFGYALRKVMASALEVVRDPKFLDLELQPSGLLALEMELQAGDPEQAVEA